MTNASPEGDETAATREAMTPETVWVRSPILGEIKVSHDRALVAIEPIAGFPGSLHYVVLPHLRSDDTPDERVAWLQSLEPPFHALPIVRREHAPRDYAPEIPSADLVRLEVRSQDDARLWLIMTVLQSGEASINLRAPLLINEAGKRMKQVVLPDESYPTRLPLLF